MSLFECTYKRMIILIKNGANVNELNKDGQTPIFKAYGNSQENKIELLLKHGARVDIKDNDGNNILHYSQYFSPKSIGLIIKASTINLLHETNNLGETPIHRADYCDKILALYKYSKMKYKDITINVKNNENLYPVYIYYKYYKVYELKNNEIISCILKISENPNEIINAQDADGNTLLHLHNHDYDVPVDLVDVILKYRPNLLIKNNYGLISLFYKGYEHVVDILEHGKKYGVNLVNEKYPVKDTRYLQTVIYMNGKYANVLKKILQLGADLNVIDALGNTPLLHLIKNVHLQNSCVKLLLEYGANVYTVDNYGRTPLFYTHNQTEDENTITEMIIRKAGNKKEYVNITDNAGETALFFNDDTLNKLLISKNNHHKHIKQFKEKIKILIKNGINLEHKNHENKTAHQACKNKEIKEFLSKYYPNNKIKSIKRRMFK